MFRLTFQNHLQINLITMHIFFSLKKNNSINSNIIHIFWVIKSHINSKFFSVHRLQEFIETGMHIWKPSWVCIPQLAENRTVLELDTRNAVVPVCNFLKKPQKNNKPNKKLRTFWLFNHVQLSRLRNGSERSLPEIWGASCGFFWYQNKKRVSVFRWTEIRHFLRAG